MKEKNFSIIIFSFIFVVTIVSAIFMFGGITTTANVVHRQLYIEGITSPYDKEANNPQPYAALDYWGNAQRGAKAGFLNEETTIVEYTGRTQATQTAFTNFFDSKPKYRAYEDTYSGIQSGCPVSYRYIECSLMKMYQDRGYIIKKIGNECCWQVQELIQEHIV